MNTREDNYVLYQTALAVAAIIIIILAGFILYSKTIDGGELNRTDIQSTPLTLQSNKQPAAKTTCKDVTSYDYNWDNDMLCTKPDGSTFYTDYAGARKY